MALSAGATSLPCLPPDIEHLLCCRVSVDQECMPAEGAPYGFFVHVELGRGVANASAADRPTGHGERSSIIGGIGATVEKKLSAGASADVPPCYPPDIHGWKRDACSTRMSSLGP